MLPGDEKCQECKHYIFTLNGCMSHPLGGAMTDYDCFEKEEDEE